MGCGSEPRQPAAREAGVHDVVLIVLDALRADALPFYGYEKQTAPFLDELASRSLVFEEARSTSSWTAPATASIFTSAHPDEHGVVTGIWAYRELQDSGSEIKINRMRRRLETLPEFMREQGYATFGVSSNPNITGKMGFRRGFDHFEMAIYTGSSVGRAPYLVDRVLTWRREIRAAPKSFVYVHFMDPHEPYFRNEKWMAPDEPPTEDPFEDRAAYDSEIRFVDQEIARLLRELDLPDPIIIVTADHGQEFEDHGGLGHGFSLYSELTRVPLLIHLPGEDAPRGRVEGRASLLDIFPTLRELVGAPPAESARGVSLVRNGEAQAPPDRPLFASRLLRVPGREVWSKHAIVNGGMELILTEPRGEPELYDVESDPGQRRDLAEARPADVERLRGQLEAHRAAMSHLAPSESQTYRPSDEDLEALRRLGYVEPAGTE